MSVIDTSDKKKVIAVAENGVPVTGAMVDEWFSRNPLEYIEDF